jgi:hypothetical protein
MHFSHNGVKTLLEPAPASGVLTLELAKTNKRVVCSIEQVLKDLDSPLPFAIRA